MLNVVTLIGRLTADPDLRYSPEGVARARFTLAVDRPHAKDGQQQTDFVDIVAWRRLAEVVAEYTRKGSLVAVQGRLQIRSYEHEGQRRRAAEVVAHEVRFLDYRKREEDDSGFDPFGEGEGDDVIPF